MKSMRGQIANLVEALSADKTPAELAQMPPVYVVRVAATTQPQTPTHDLLDAAASRARKPLSKQGGTITRLFNRRKSSKNRKRSKTPNSRPSSPCQQCVSTHSKVSTSESVREVTAESALTGSAAQSSTQPPSCECSCHSRSPPAVARQEPVSPAKELKSSMSSADSPSNATPQTVIHVPEAQSGPSWAVPPPTPPLTSIRVHMWAPQPAGAPQSSSSSAASGTSAKGARGAAKNKKMDKKGRSSPTSKTSKTESVYKQKPSKKKPFFRFF